MKRASFIAALLSWTFIYTSNSQYVKADNVLSENEKKEGWKLLFDGNSMNGWRAYQNKAMDSWTAENGTLHCRAKSLFNNRGNLISTRKYQDFVFEADWKLTPQGNSGILYMVTEEFNEPYLSGPEYQIIDDKNYPEKLQSWQLTGANYAMDPPLTLAANPIEEWNHTRIVIRKGHVEHWLNGKKVVSYDLWTKDWRLHKFNGKWKDANGYGMSKKGFICLQDHGSEIWFKNIKLKEL